MDLNHLTKEELWKLRKEIKLNSLFTKDYENDFGISASACNDFFDGFVEDCWEKANAIHREDDALDLYDNADSLYDYYQSLELPFDVVEDNNYEEDKVDGSNLDEEHLTERQWKYTIPSKYRDALVEASDEEDGNKVIQAVSDIIEQVKLGINKIEGDDEAGESEVYGWRDELESHKGESFDEMANEVDNILSDLYDFCDNYGIFLGLIESCTKKISNKLESKCVTKENTVLAEDDDNDETINSVYDNKLDDKTGAIGHKAERPEDIENKDDDEEEDETKPETDDNPLHTLPKTLEPIIEFPSGNFVYVDWDSKEHKLIAGGGTNTGVIREFELKYDDDKSLNGNLQDLYDLIGKKHPDYLEEINDEGGVTPTEESLNEAKEDFASKSWMLNQIISHMNNEEAYYGGWLYEWPDGESKEEAAEDFKSKEDYDSLEKSFESNYKAYHKDGLTFGGKDSKLSQEEIDAIMNAAHDWDKKLGLTPIANVDKEKPLKYDDAMEKDLVEFIEGQGIADDDFEIQEEADQDDLDKPYKTIYFNKDEDANKIYDALKALNKYKTVKLYHSPWGSDMNSDSEVLVSNFEYGSDSNESLNKTDSVELYTKKTDEKPYKICTREEAIKSYREAIDNTEGSEQERMKICLNALKQGKTKIYDYLDESLKEDDNIKNIRSDTKEGDIRPTPEQIKTGKEMGWEGFELAHGYGVFNDGPEDSGTDFDYIAHIDDMGTFDGDEEAAEQAKKDGFKFLKLTDEQEKKIADVVDYILPSTILDNVNNRKVLKSLMADDESLKEEKDLTKIKGTISNYVGSHKDEIFALAPSEIAMGKKTIDILNKAITDKALTAGEEGHAKLWINKLQNDIARNKKYSLLGSITTLTTGTVVKKREESIDKTDKPAIVEEDKEEKSMNKLEEKPEDKPEDKEPDDDGDDFESKKAKLHSKLDELAVDYTDDAIDIVNNIIDEAEEGQDMSDLISEEVDNACIYFNDCFDYLKVSHNTDFKDAIDNGLNDVTSIAAWYMEEEVSELLGKVTNSDD